MEASRLGVHALKLTNMMSNTRDLIVSFLGNDIFLVLIAIQYLWCSIGWFSRKS